MLTPEEKDILAKALSFSLLQNKLDYCDFLLPYEYLHRQLKRETIYTGSGFDDDSFKTKLINASYYMALAASGPNTEILQFDGFISDRIFPLLLAQDRGFKNAMLISNEN